MVVESGAFAGESNTSSSTKSPSRSTICMDPEFITASAPNVEALASIAPSLPHTAPTTALEVRANAEVILSALLGSFNAKAGDDINTVLETTHSIPSFDGAVITITHFATAAQRAAAAAPGSGPPRRRRAVLHIHGGGFITGSVAIFAAVTKRNVLTWDTPVFAVEYRVAPENPAPGLMEDCWAALQWLSTHAADFGVDPARIVVVGESAGGGVAAGLALAARDRGLSPPLAKVVLVYPMLDDRTIGKYDGVVDWPTRPYLSWTEAQNEIGWKAYLGDDRAGRADVEVSVYDAPGRATVKDLVGLPSTYVDVGGLDLFLDEDIAFASRLSQANVQTEFHLYPGLPHGFENSVTPALVRSALANRTRAICSV